MPSSTPPADELDLDLDPGDERVAAAPPESEAIASRYGRGRRTRRRNLLWIIVGITTLVVAFALWAAFIGLHWFEGGSSSLQSTTATFRDIREHSIVVSFGVEATPGDRVACSVQALDPNYTVVGWKVFEYPPSTQQSNTYTVTLRTIRTSTTGEVDECWILGPAAPRANPNISG